MAEPRVKAVVVNYNAGSALGRCVDSLRENGVTDVVVVDNVSTDASMSPEVVAKASSVVFSVSNLGYGGAANLGARQGEPSELLLVCNPDLVAAPGCVDALCSVLDARPNAAMVGPMLKETSGVVYPSGRDFPGLVESLGHGFLGMVWGGNRWTKRYRHVGPDQHEAREADWVSGAFFLVRTAAFDEVGGFDERYFMYVEDVDLCWRLRRQGWDIWYEPSAVVVHEQGRSTSHHPYRMLVAHHRSMWRFARQTSGGTERLLLPVVAAGLAFRLVLAWLEHLLRVRDKLAARHG